MKKLSILALCMVLALSAFALPASAESTSYTSMYSSEISTLNYLITSNTNDFSLSANLIDTLVEYDNYGRIQPSLAESWTVDETGLVWTFNLRKDATWVTHQGEYVANVTANDFVSAAKYMLNDANASAVADVFYDVIAGAEAYYDSTIVPEEGEEAPAPVDFATVGVKALDDYTLQYTLAAPCPYFESMLTYVCFMPVYEPFLSKMGDAFGVANGPDTILYCGAYILSEFKPQEKRLLVKNASNWDADKVYIETIEYRHNKESSTISAEMYKRGEVDSATISSIVASEWLQDEATASLIRPVRQTSFYTYFFSFCFKPTFDEKYEPDNWMLAVNNEAFRKSIYYGMDRVKAMLATEPDNPESIMFNTVTPKDFSLLNGVDFTNIGELNAISALGTDTFNKETALAYKEQAIKELTAQGATFPVQIYVRYNPTVSGWDSECQIIEQQLEGLLGTDYINVVVEAGPTNGFNDATRRAGNYGMQKCNWGPDYADPQTFSEPFDVGNNYNFMDIGANKADMEEYYKLLEEAKAITVDIPARYAAFAKAEAYLINKAYIIPFGFGNGGYTASRIDPFTTQYAPFGISNYRYKGSKLLEQPMDTDAYFDAYYQWIDERAAITE